MNCWQTLTLWNNESCFVNNHCNICFQHTCRQQLWFLYYVIVKSIHTSCWRLLNILVICVSVSLYMYVWCIYIYIYIYMCIYIYIYVHVCFRYVMQTLWIVVLQWCEHIVLCYKQILNIHCYSIMFKRNINTCWTVSGWHICQWY